MSLESNGIDTVLGEIRRLQNQAGAGASLEPEPTGSGDFGSLFKSLVDGVNDTQQTAAALRSSYSLGEGKHDLAEVMIAQQQSRVAFQGLLQVRKHLISAYQEIMNMPI